jgi:hypothetical protein
MANPADQRSLLLLRTRWQRFLTVDRQISMHV